MWLGLPAVRLRLAMRALGTGPRNVVNRNIGHGMTSSHGSLNNLSHLSSAPSTGMQKVEVIASGQLEVDGFMWTTRQYVLTPAALQLYVVGDDSPCDVLLVENVKELAVGVGEHAVDVLLHCWNASRHALPATPSSKEIVTWRLRLESAGSRSEFTHALADAMRKLQVTHAWRESLLPLPTPDVTLVHVAVRALKRVDVEYTAARNLNEGGRFALVHVFGASMLHLGLATPIGPCTVNLPVADLIRHALDRTPLSTQAHMSCDNAGRKVRCNLKLAFKVQTETTPTGLVIGFLMCLLLAHCLRVMRFGTTHLVVMDVYAVLGVLQLAALLMGASWACFSFSSAGSAFIRCVIGQTMSVDVKRMELVAEPEDGPQSFQELLDGEVPGRFVEGSPEDLDDARKRWVASCKYKRDKQIFNLLEVRYHYLCSRHAPECSAGSEYSRCRRSLQRRTHSRHRGHASCRASTEGGLTGLDRAARKPDASTVAGARQERQPRFDLLKSVYPMCYHKRCKIGRPLVIEKLSSLKESMRVMKQNGISVDDVLRQVTLHPSAVRGVEAADLELVA